MNLSSTIIRDRRRSVYRTATWSKDGNSDRSPITFRPPETAFEEICPGKSVSRQESADLPHLAQSLFPRTNPAWAVRRAILPRVRGPFGSATVQVRTEVTLWGEHETGVSHGLQAMLRR